MAHLTSFPQTTKVYPIALALLLALLASPAFANYSVQLTWDASPGEVQGYKVYMGTSPGSYPSLEDAGLNQSFLIQNVPDGKSYYFAVTAYDQTGNESVPSGEVTITIPDITPPSAPGQPTLSSTSDSSIAFQWTASTDNVGVTDYEVARDAQVIGQSQTTTFTDNTIVPDQTYHYAVRARDAAGNVSPWSTQLEVTSTPSITYAQLQVDTTGNGTVLSTPDGINCPDINCFADYPVGTIVTLTAIPGKNWHFNGWSGGCTGTETCQITLTENASVRANFSPPGRANGRNF